MLSCLGSGQKPRIRRPGQKDVTVEQAGSALRVVEPGSKLPWVHLSFSMYMIYTTIRGYIGAA